MELLNFYFQSIFYFFEIPDTSQVCASGSSITYLCKSILNFSATYSFIMLLFVLFLAKDLNKSFKFLTFAILQIVVCFFFADKILSKISNPATYGMEPLIISFYSWTFIMSFLVMFGLFYQNFRKRFLIIAVLTTVIFSALFGLFGRGTYEQFIIVTGSLGNVHTLESIMRSEIIIVGFWFLISSIAISLYKLAYTWVKDAKLLPEVFFDSIIYAVIFCLILPITLISLPIGSAVNKSDIEAAKVYIAKIKDKADRYYLENGEYPKFVGDIVEKLEDDNPWLLKRHEYFTLGVRGTYYFSRAEKYCFIFQNPSSDFSYFSMTNMRGWNKYSETKSFDDSYLAMCDEVYENEETLVADHLGMESPDDRLRSLSFDLNQPNTIPQSRESTTILHDRIMKYGEEDTDVFNYYRNNYEGD